MSPRLALPALALAIVAGCTAAASRPATLRPSPPPPGPSHEASLRFVALGDSYTIGTSVRIRDRWPNQLVRALRPDIDMVISANLAQNAASSEDVIVEQLPRLQALRPDVISLLVGVNDVVAGVGPETYRDNLAAIMKAISQRVPAAHAFVITTPDYTLTPHGGDYADRAEQSAAIAQFNRILTDEATARGMHVVDISPVSDRVSDDPTLVAAGDGLHPSAKQYAGWVEIIARAMRAGLGEG